MPRYFFHLRDGLDVPDEEGTELPSLEVARAHAIDLLRFEASETVKREARIDLQHRIEIKDDRGQVLDTVLLSDVVKIESSS